MVSSVKYIGKGYLQCERCQNTSFHTSIYENTGMITGNKLKMCKQCIYKENFGTKNWRKNMKKGVFDG
tara:strand:+ start:4271 stop:4474 length:204 start_codon:yes stop_codon:yes gene_type:complete